MSRTTLHWIAIAAFFLAGCGLSRTSGADRAPKASDDRDAETAAPHPRLFFTDDDIPHLKAAIARDPLLSHHFDELRHQGEAMLLQQPATYIRDTEKALIQSRLVLTRVSTLAGLYRLTGEERFAVRARDEMLAAARFPDWHPADFLPDAELINAMSVGYDWLYKALRVEDRNEIRDAILMKGLQPAKEAYDHQADWTRTVSNHNIVGNGGVAMGAVALDDVDPKLCHDLLVDARKTLPAAMDQYDPDGAWPEGPIYWDYATRYATFYSLALKNAGIEERKYPGFSATGMFRIYSTGPTKKTFNFGDAEDTIHPAPFMYWLAGEYKKPVYAAHEEYVSPNDANVFGLIYHTRLAAVGSFEQEATTALPPSAIFRGSELAFLRSDWSPDATWIGFKGGTNKGTHRHLDLGSFVLDAMGERWALDLGPDDYGLPAYNGTDKRWTYYRCQTVGHNALTIGGPNQLTDGDANLVAFHSDSQRAFAVVDLTNAYPHAHAIYRGIELLDDRDVAVVDEIDLGSAQRVTWNFHTAAEVSANGSTATLREKGKSLRMQILEPSEATFDPITAAAPPPQKDNKGVTNLTIHLPRAVEKTRIVVLIEPATTAEPALRHAEADGHPADSRRDDSGRDHSRIDDSRLPKIEPLKQWIEEGRIKK